MNCTPEQSKPSLLTVATTLTNLGAEETDVDSSTIHHDDESRQSAAMGVSGVGNGNIRSLLIRERHQPIRSAYSDTMINHRIEDDVPMTFPQRLMEVLDNEVYAEIVSWLSHGKGFMIFQKKTFATEVMPKFFKQSKFTSFTRKLNRWGFTRVSRGPEMGAYFHQYFQRGNLRLCMQMSCQSNNKPASSTTSLVDPSVAGNMNNALASLRVSGSGRNNHVAINSHATQDNFNYLFTDPNASLLRLKQLQQEQERLLLKQQLQLTVLTQNRLAQQGFVHSATSSSSYSGSAQVVLSQHLPENQLIETSYSDQDNVRDQTSSALSEFPLSPTQGYGSAITNAAVGSFQRNNTNDYFSMRRSQGLKPEANSSSNQHSTIFQQQLNATTNAQHQQLGELTHLDYFPNSGTASSICNAELEAQSMEVPTSWHEDQQVLLQQKEQRRSNEGLQLDYNEHMEQKKQLVDDFEPKQHQSDQLDQMQTHLQQQNQDTSSPVSLRMTQTLVSRRASAA